MLSKALSSQNIQLKMTLFTVTFSSGFPFNNIFTVYGRPRPEKNTAVSSHYSEHKISTNERMSLVLYVNKEGFQPSFLFVNDDLKS